MGTWNSDGMALDFLCWSDGLGHFLTVSITPQKTAYRLASFSHCLTLFSRLDGKTSGGIVLFIPFYFAWISGFGGVAGRTEFSL